MSQEPRRPGRVIRCVNDHSEDPVRRLKITNLLFAVGTVGLLACGGGGEAGGESAQGAEGQMEESLGEIDPQLASRGEELFTAKGCNACHRFDERLVGPPLTGVTERRSRAFIVGMITNPDSMLVNNSAAKEMLAQYAVPMANQGLTRDEALALFEYFRQRDSGSSAGE